MTTYRYTAFLAEDHARLVTAWLIGEAGPVAVAPRGADALAQLKDFVKWRIAQDRPLAAPDLTGAALFEVEFSVRPAYRTATRVQPATRRFALRASGVRGKLAGGDLFTAALPMHELRFDYARADELEPLAQALLVQMLDGHSPAELSRFLPPVRTWLEEVVVRLPSRPKPPAPPAAPENLAQVAEPVATRTHRGKKPRAWERDAERDRVVTLAAAGTNVLLVGPPGSGKSTVLAEAVRRLEKTPGAAEDDEPRARHRWWLTGAARLIAGMKYLGEWQERCEELVDELSSIGGTLCVENLLDLVSAGATGGEGGVASFWMPYLVRGELKMIAEATPEELDACRRLRPGLAELFQIVRVEPLDRARTVAVLAKIVEAHRSGGGRPVDDEVPALIGRLFARFLPYAVAPGPQAAFLAELFAASARTRGAITVRTALDHFIRRTGLPEAIVSDEVTLTSGDVAAALAREVVAQEPACREVARLVATFKAGLNDPGRPLGALLFSGPTGVGKTELARALARWLFGHGEEKDRLVRLDMSEYGGYAAAERLVGAPGGEPSELVRKLRRQPFCVVLLDEIEKAHPEVFDVLLSVLDEGRLTDAYGRVTSFASAVILMTSNLGAQARRPAGYGEAEAASAQSSARGFFRPEFFNRLDAVVAFAPLGPESIARLAERELARIAQREGLEHRGITLAWSRRVVDAVVAAGHDRRYGARPLQRAVETLVVTPLARWLLADPRTGRAHLELDLDEHGRLTIRPPDAVAS